MPEDEMPPVEGVGQPAEQTDVPPEEIQLDAEVTAEEETFDYDVECAFIMFLEPNGHWAADPNISKRCRIQRQANFNDFFHAAVDLEKDINSMEIANRSVQVQQQVAAQMAQQMQNQKLLDATQGKGGLDLSKLRRP